MGLETLSSNELLNFIIYDTISATPFTTNDHSSEINNTFFFHHLQHHNPNNPNLLLPQQLSTDNNSMEITSNSNSSLTAKMSEINIPADSSNKLDICQKLGVLQKKKKRRRKPRVCKNKEEAETQRMTHIAVERNRRKQMNQHLAVMRSLMPESYVQRGDQASIVGGAIEFVKELEHLLQSLEAKKLIWAQQQQDEEEEEDIINLSSSSSSPPFSQFFSYPQYTCSQIPNNYTSKSKESVADIEVNLIETHANLRILSHNKRLTQLSKMVACFHTLHLSVLHLNVTTLDPLVLYSISLKVEEGCRLNSAEEIAGAVHQMFRIIEEEATLCVVDSIN